MTPPVIFLIFNRPEVTAQTFDAIRRAQPARLFVVADGARIGRPKEAALCEQARRITEHVDWPCVVLRNYSEDNLGCGKRVSSGISWAFESTEEAIILEDDCLVDPSFFQFCALMLDLYRDDPKVMMISAGNFLGDQRFSDGSYYFSRYAHIWGWATWRRAWKNYDFTMRDWPHLRRRWLSRQSMKWITSLYWRKMFDAVAVGKLDTWDYQWQFAIWKHLGTSIVPNVNMVKNIGFGADATHTISSSGTGLSLAQMQPMTFPLLHPAEVAPDEAADRFEESKLFPTPVAKARLILSVLLRGLR